MSAQVCLQGGAELQPGCEAMDAEMLAGPDGSPRRVLVVPYAGRPGREREVAGGNARRWYTGLGAREVTVSLDEDDLPDALAEAELVVLLGGSPDRLLEGLAPHAAALRAALAAGTWVSGSSAGAMVLCRWTVLPGGRRRVEAGLALVDVDLVVPHYRGGTQWLDAARSVLPERPLVLGLPERSGVVVGADGSRRPVGEQAPTELGG